MILKENLKESRSCSRGRLSGKPLLSINMAEELDRIKADSEEKNFVRLFEEALKTFRGDLSDDDISKGIKDTISEFRKSIFNSCSIENFQYHYQRCGYFFRYSAPSAGLARDRVLDAIRNCQELRFLLTRQSMKILSIGSGPGSDIIGLCSAFYEVNEIFKPEFILVDHNIEWKVYFCVLFYLLRNNNFGYASSLFRYPTKEPLFITADTKFRPEGDYLIALKTADIIWMKGLLSILHCSCKRHFVIQNVISSMARGALLLVVDSPFCDTFDEYSDILERLYSQKNERYSFNHRPAEDYGYGFSPSSNQIINVFMKK
ncbi:uncharacterized protein NPIL_149402 [Nephila pilipes]|uniref:Uncharacterized protein n=1 Tax=Nephila pilipes TaxID=299642 RepID=A0A8X6PGS7_NEPPI|nr:uncharacterized protein NPIL_149402 [Nephila pilipes]